MEAQLPESMRPPEHPSVLPHSQAKPLLRMISRMMKPKLRMPGKKMISNQDIHISHKKVKYW